MNFGIIGCGTVAELDHLPVLQALPGARLLAAADRDPARLAATVERFAIPRAYPDAESLLADPEIQAVVVATHMDSHFPIVMQAAAQRKHVLCEKPIATTVAQGQRMVRAMESAGRILAVNFVLRETQPLVDIKRLVDEGCLGQIKALRFVFLSSGPGWAGQRRLEALMNVNGGPIVDCGVHYFDLARWITGHEFVDVHATGLKSAAFENPDQVTATGRLTGGETCLVDISWVYSANCQDSARIRRYDVIGDCGTVSYSSETELLTIRTSRGTEVRTYPSETKNLSGVYEKFLRAVSGDPTDLPTGTDGIIALELALTALASSRTPASPASLQATDRGRNGSGESFQQTG